MSDIETMTTELKERKRKKPGLYCEVSNEQKAAAISADVSFKRESLMDQRQKVNLDSIADVRKRANDFLRACEDAAVIPTFLGLCVSFGYSREGLYRYLRVHSNSETAQFIELVRETLADALIASSLTRTTDAATSIFALKNLHGFSDKIEVAPVVEKPGPLGELQDPEALQQRILGTVCLEDDEI